MSRRNTKVETERRYMAELGRRLRRLREGQGLTQSEAAELTGVSADMISRLENGRYGSPGLRTLLRLSTGLGTTLAQLLPDAGPAVTEPMQARFLALIRRAKPKEVEMLIQIATTIMRGGADD